MLIERRLLRDVEHEQRRASLRQVLSETKPAWHGVRPNQPDWSLFSHSIAIAGEPRNEGISGYVILNAYWEALDFELPIVDGGRPWRRWIDTALEPPHDICAWNAEPIVPESSYRVGARSVVVLIADNGSMQAISSGAQS
jgi:glycogen operon protein